jgi:hypothetical protein
MSVQMIDDRCQQCGQGLVVTNFDGVNYEGHCPGCNNNVYGSIAARVERHKDYDIVVIPYENMYRFRVRKIGGSEDWNPQIDAASQEDAVAKAKDYIDTVPVTDWTIPRNVEKGRLRSRFGLDPFLKNNH